MNGVPMRGIAAVISCIAVYGMAGGAAYPLLSLALESRGVADSVIGMNAAAGAAASILVVPLFPRILARLPARVFLLAAAAVTATPPSAAPAWRCATGGGAGSRCWRWR